MLQGWVIVLVSLAYIGVLFAIAYYGDKQADAGRRLINNPYIYALSLGVYCTAWTFYGSVGRAARTGVGFLPIYLGPTLMMALSWFILRKIIRISKTNHITSIADFIAARYGKSTLLSGLVTIVAVFGIIPYIGLQLKAVSTSFTLLWHYPAIVIPSNLSIVPIINDTAFYITGLLILFTILFGTRHLEATEQHEGLVLAIAFESLVKLVAFLVVGVFVTFFIYDGFSDLFEQAANNPALENLFTMQGSYGDWVWLTGLSMLAVLFLPRQFQMAVIENVDEDHIKKAIWLFPLYLVVINIFVLPIAFGGLLTFPGGDVLADTFVLTLPMVYNQGGIALLAFIGGLSASISMVVVATVTLCTMVSNDLVLPLLIRLPTSRLIGGGDLSRLLLLIRRAAIVIILLLSYSYIRTIGQYRELVSIGLISFTAAAQFAPIILGGIYWKGGTRWGALVGLSGGFLVWIHTLFLPSFVESGFISHSVIDQGLLGLGLLKPYELFGLQGLDPITHAMLWSMIVNIGGYIVVSLLTEHQTALEHAQASRFVDVFKYSDNGQVSVWRGQATVKNLRSLLERFLGTTRAAELFEEYAQHHKVNWSQTKKADAQLVDFVETRLARVIGAASAQVVVASMVKEEPLNTEEVLSILDETSTNYRLLSEQLQTYSNELEEKNQQLKEKNEELERLNHLKDDFLANTSHELRTPLNGIIGLAESMIDGAAGPLNEMQKKNLSMVIYSGQRLTNLVNDILDFAKIKHDALTLQVKPLYLPSLVDVVLTLSYPLIGSKKLELVNAIEPGLPPVCGDENRVQQILHNLIGNAVKFTESGQVEVSARVITAPVDLLHPWKSHQKYVAVTVSDTGIGIPQNKLTDIFEAFQQADGSIARAYGGTGLGLAVTKKLVELHGGGMRVESAPGHGSRFTFTLLVSDEEPEKYDQFYPANLISSAIVDDTEIPPMEAVTSLTNENGFNILVVDDEPVNRQVVVNQLSLQKYNVTEARNGFEALELIQTERPFNLVVLDVMMPRMSGYEVCRELRRHHSATELPVIMLTAKNRATDLIAGFDAGANDYVTKPFSSVELLVRIRTHVQLTTLYHDLQQYQHQLEDLVAARTLRLEIMASLGEYFNAILDLDKLLSEIVNQVEKNFGYYHAHVYRLDERHERLILAEGTGPTGQKMKERGHNIALNAPKSLVARAARTNEIAWASDVRANPDWLPNPLLPDTRSEMAVPISVDGRVVGVLDVQENKVAGLDEGDANLLRSLASQIGVAVRNAQLYGLAQQANEELRRLNADKDKFFSIVAHDLRGPFGPVMSMSQFLQEMYGELQEEQLKEICEVIYRSANNVYRLLENLLEWSQLQMGRMQYQPRRLNLLEIVERNMNLLAESAVDKQINLRNQLDQPIYIHADAYMVDTVIRNLVSNALKFTPPAGSITVAAHFRGSEAIGEKQFYFISADTSRPTSFVEVSVADTGVGISQDNIDKLFKIGVHHTTRGTNNERGTGLGLIMCQEMIEKHGGKIWVESEVGHGATFKFTLPADVPSIMASRLPEPERETIEASEPETTKPPEPEYTAVPSTMLSVPPPEEMTILLDLAMAGDMAGVQERARHIKQLAVEFEPFANKLQRLAKDFEEDRILKLVEQHVVQM